MTRIENGLVSGKLRFAFFKKCSDALMSVVGFKATQLSFGFVTKHFLEFSGFTHVDRVLCGRECDWRCCTQSFGKLQRHAFQLLWCYNLVHESPSRCFLGVNRFAQKEHLARLIRCHEPRQEISSAPIGMKPNFSKRLTKRGGVARNTQVTRESEITTRA